MNKNNKDNEDMSEEDILKASEAYLIFVQRFGEYVKEMNPELWHRAREYAADFTKVTGVTIELVDNDEDEKDDRDTEHKNGAD
jgi:hypothetical protein